MKKAVDCSEVQGDWLPDDRAVLKQPRQGLKFAVLKQPLASCSTGPVEYRATLLGGKQNQ